MGYGRYVQWFNGASKPDCTSWLSGDCSQIDEKERKKQREIARAKKKFGINNLENTQSNFSLSQEEAQVLLKLAKQVVGKGEKQINETKETTTTNKEEA